MSTKEIMMNLRRRRGILRSRLIYDFKPGARRRLISFYRSFISEGDLCFDIGAHTGNHTAAWLELGARVVAVEPQPAFAKLLRAKFSKNPDADILEMAIAEKQEIFQLNINMANPTLSTLSEKWRDIILAYNSGERWDEIHEVESISLDQLVSKYGIPTFCKIDVEGFEENVLKGLSYGLPALSFEFFPTTPERTLKCLHRIDQLGNYRFNYSFREQYSFQSVKWKDSKSMQTEIIDYKGRKSGDIYAIRI